MTFENLQCKVSPHVNYDKIMSRHISNLSYTWLVIAISGNAPLRFESILVIFEVTLSVSNFDCDELRFTLLEYEISLWIVYSKSEEWCRTIGKLNQSYIRTRWLDISLELHRSSFDIFTCLAILLRFIVINNFFGQSQTEILPPT